MWTTGPVWGSERSIRLSFGPFFYPPTLTTLLPLSSWKHDAVGVFKNFQTALYNMNSI